MNDLPQHPGIHDNLTDPSASAVSQRIPGAESQPRQAHLQPQNTPHGRVQLSATGLIKNFHKGPVDIPVLRGVDLFVKRGEFLSIVGRSGSGKSTLLHLLSTLDVPDGGEIYFHDNRIDNLPSTPRDRLRNKHFGMIFQFYHLLPELTALENVLAPIMISQSLWCYLRRRKEHLREAQRILKLVGLDHRTKHTPRELSGGEMQRVAIARALIAHPDVLFADEPTGNLDKTTGEEIMRMLRSLNREENLTIVMVTHDQAIAAAADRAVRLVEGRLATL